MQSDRSTRYASETAADARRYVLTVQIQIAIEIQGEEENITSTTASWINSMGALDDAVLHTFISRDFCNYFCKLSEGVSPKAAL
jgi:hypothetical protein